jgi:hypothetical protein
MSKDSAVVVVVACVAITLPLAPCVAAADGSAAHVGLSACWG